jgi:hypothetical protein
MIPPETTKKSPMRVAPGICVQEINMNTVGWRDGGYSMMVVSEYSGMMDMTGLLCWGC